MFQVKALLARQRIHMKNQALFSSKDKSKKLKCRLLQFLFGALRDSERMFEANGVDPGHAALIRRLI